MNKQLRDASHIESDTAMKMCNDENVRTYVDELHFLFSLLKMPKAMQMDILIDDLEPELRMQVVATIPKTAEQAIQNAVHLQECLTGAVADKLRLYEGQYKKTGSDTIEQLASSLGRMIVALHNNSSKQGFMLRQAYDDDATDSDVPARLTDYVCEPFLESNACFLANQCFSEDYVPSTPEAEMYVVQMPTRSVGGNMPDVDCSQLLTLLMYQGCKCRRWISSSQWQWHRPHVSPLAVGPQALGHHVPGLTLQRETFYFVANCTPTLKACTKT